MRAILTFVLCLMLPPAFAAVTLTESTSVSLYKGTSKVGDHPSWDACQTAARAEANKLTTGSATWSCKTEVRKVVGVYAADSPTSAVTVTASASPTQVAPGAGATLTWSSTNATSCTASSGGQSGPLPATSGSTPTGPLSATTTITVSCANASGQSASAPVTITVGSSAPPDPTPPPAGATALLYTDLTHGPVGAPLTVCGRGFGTSPVITIGGQSASIVEAKASRNPQFECVRVRADRGGALALNGVASSLTYTVQPGDFLYVSQSGNDATAAKNDPAKPWRYLQKADRTGAFAAARPGDIILVRGGTWTDSGFDGAWVRPHAEDGTAPTGVKGTGYLTVTSYPNERVIVQGQARGGVMGGSSARKGIAGRYMVISNLTITGGTTQDGAPINLQYASDNWRVINNDLSWPNAPSIAKAGGITGIGTNAKILGVNIHDIGGPYENHGIYLFSEAQDMEIGWAWIHGVALGNLFQTYDGSSPTGIRRIQLHDSVLEGGGRYGINVGNQTRELTVSNVTVRNTALAGLRFDINATFAVDFQIRDSVLENVNTKGSQSSRGVVNCDWVMTNGKAVVERNKFSAGPAATSYVSITGAGCPILQLSGNTWTGLSGAAPP